MTSSNGNIFRVTGPLCGEFTGHRWIPHTKASDAELWCFLWSAPWINGWVNNREAGDLRRHSAHYDAIVMVWYFSTQLNKILKRIPNTIFEYMFSTNNENTAFFSLWIIIKTTEWDILFNQNPRRNHQAETLSPEDEGFLSWRFLGGFWLNRIPNECVRGFFFF